eukprot:403336796
MTVRQIRDLFYSLWNISVATTRIKETEVTIEKIQTKCYKLSYDDEQLSNRINQNNTSYLKTFEDIQKDSKQSKLDHERKFSDFFHRISNNFESIKKLKQYAEEQKMFQEMIVNKSESIISRVNKVRDNIMDELKTAKTELQTKLEETDKYYGDQMEITQSQIDKNKVLQKEMLLRTKEDLQQSIKNESLELKNYINLTKDEIYNDRGNIQNKYDDKLRKIKEICSQYFNKYEKELLNNQEKMKELDARCEEWAKLIVQPQELNQARLFAIETRMKESEEFKVKEVNFIKDTLKKLIFAMEQSEFQKGSSSNKKHANNPHHQSHLQSSQFIQEGGSNQTPFQDYSTYSHIDRAQTTLKPNKQNNNNLTIDAEQHGAPLPNLMIANKNRGQSTVRSAAIGTRLHIRENSSGIGGNDRLSMASTSLDYQSQLPTYDILFLKRLLFLKASIDQDHTNDSYKVPIVSAPPLNQDLDQNVNLNKSFGQEMLINPLDDQTTVYNTRVGTTQLFQDRKKKYQFDGSSTRVPSNRRQIQGNSIDLQDYLNFQTGLDYSKVKVKVDKSRKIKSSQVTTRDQNYDTIQRDINDTISSGTGKIQDLQHQNISNQNQQFNSILNQIQNNKYISDMDYQKEKQLAEDNERKQRINEAQYPTFELANKKNQE